MVKIVAAALNPADWKSQAFRLFLEDYAWARWRGDRGRGCWRCYGLPEGRSSVSRNRSAFWLPTFQLTVVYRHRISQGRYDEQTKLHGTYCQHLAVPTHVVVKVRNVFTQTRCSGITLSITVGSPQHFFRARCHHACCAHCNWRLALQPEAWIRFSETLSALDLRRARQVCGEKVFP